MCRKLGIRVAFFSCNLLYCIKYKNLNIAEETYATQEGHSGGSRPRASSSRRAGASRAPGEGNRGAVGAERLEGEKEKESPRQWAGF